jgi:hypothetical protein
MTRLPFPIQYPVPLTISLPTGSSVQTPPDLFFSFVKELGVKIWEYISDCIQVPPATNPVPEIPTSSKREFTVAYALALIDKKGRLPPSLPPSLPLYLPLSLPTSLPQTEKPPIQLWNTIESMHSAMDAGVQSPATLRDVEMEDNQEWT